MSNPKMSSSTSNADNTTESQLNIKLPILINGTEKYATGLTRRTTIDDVKFAMLSASDPTFIPSMIDDYGVFEKWQGNERILDGKIKVYKLIRLWQSLPGDQLAHVKFMIKKRMQITSSSQKSRMSFRESNQADGKSSSKKYSFCTLSPSNSKTWNLEKQKRKSQRESQYVSNPNRESNSDSGSDVDGDLDSCCSDTSNCEDNKKFQSHKRYASIKRFNRSRKSTIRHTQQIKKSFIDLVTKQNEIIDKQLNKLGDLNEIEQNVQLECISKRFKNAAKSLHRSKSCEKKALKELNIDDINEHDIKSTFPDCKLDEKQAKEYSKLVKDYLKLQHSLNSKMKKIDELKLELDEEEKTQPKFIKSVIKTNKKLQASIDTNKIQNEKLTDLGDALNKIDDVICLKEKFIQSLEQELQRLENCSNELIYMQKSATSVGKKSLAFTSESTMSSTSSVFTSISSISSSQSSNYPLFNNQSQKLKQQDQPNSVTTKGQFCTYGDNESDTGISSANSDDFSNQLETLV